jgi:hypothetical protein
MGLMIFSSCTISQRKENLEEKAARMEKQISDYRNPVYYDKRQPNTEVLTLEKKLVLKDGLNFNSVE